MAWKCSMFCSSAHLPQPHSAIRTSNRCMRQRMLWELLCANGTWKIMRRWYVATYLGALCWSRNGSVGALSDHSKRSSLHKLMWRQTTSRNVWVELRPLLTKVCEGVVQFFFDEIIMRYGCPQEILPDKGKEFCNVLLNIITIQMTFKHVTTSPYISSTV